MLIHLVGAETSEDISALRAQVASGSLLCPLGIKVAQNDKTEKEPACVNSKEGAELTCSSGEAPVWSVFLESCSAQ